MPRRFDRGVTLIELLIVIVLLGLAIALVGPLTVEQIDNSRARNERLKLKRWFVEQSFYAFTQQQPVQLWLEGKAVYGYNPELGDKTQVILQLDYLFFDPQPLLMNAHGFVRPQLIRYHYRGREETMQLDTLPVVNHAQ